MFVVAPLDLSRISPTSIWNVCEVISRLNSSSFCVVALRPEFKTRRARANLRYLTAIHLLVETEQGFEVAVNARAQLFFKSVQREDRQARRLFREHLLSLKDVQHIMHLLSPYGREEVSVRYFTEQLERIDRSKERKTYYSRAARFLAGILHLAGLVEYAPGRRRMRALIQSLQTSEIASQTTTATSPSPGAVETMPSNLQRAQRTAAGNREGAIARGKHSSRLQVIVSKEEKRHIEAMAKEENRSISNWIYDVIQQELQNGRD